MRTFIKIKDLLGVLDKALGVSVIASVFALIFVVSHRAIFDLDIWLHLKTGAYILQNGVIPTHDIFSFTLNAKPWVDHEWLFQVLCSIIYNKWDAEGLILLQTYVIALSFFILFLMGYRQIRSFLEVGVFVFVASYACLGRFNIRPDIFSVLFFALCLYLLRFHINKKRIWLLIPAQILWVNIHGYFFLGPLVTFFFLISEFIRRKCPFLPWQWKEESALSENEYSRLKKLFIFLLAACVFNPQGIAGLLYPAGVFKEVLFGTNRIFFKHIQELQPTFTKLTYSGNFYYLISVFCFVLMIFNFKKLKIAEVFLAVFFFIFGLTVRNVAFFAFIAYMITITYLSETLIRASENVRLETSLRQVLYYLIKYGVAIYFIFWIGQRADKIAHEGYYDFNKNKFASTLFGIQENRYPKGAVDFVLKHEIKQNLFNDFNSGAYLIGAAYPKVKVFIDGRTEMYGEEFFTRYLETMRGQLPAAQNTLDKYNIGAVLLSLTSSSLPSLISYLYKNPEWKIVFLDETGVIFLKDVPENQEVIKTYGVDFAKYHPPSANLQAIGLRKVYPWPYLQRAGAFSLIKEDSLVIEETKEALRIMPDCVRAHYLLGKAYLNKGLLLEALESLRASLLYAPRSVDALADIGSCLRQLKDYNSAKQALKGAIRFSAGYAPAHYELGRVYLEEGRESKAIQVLKKANKLAPGNAAYHYELGAAFLQKAEKLKDESFFKKANEEFERAKKLNIPLDALLSEKILLKEKESKDLLRK